MPDTIDCTPKALLEASACFCFPQPDRQAGAMIYLLNVISGLNLTPNQLMEASKCFCFTDKQMQQAVLTYLLCQIAQTEST